MILSLTFFATGVFCYTIKELQSHRKLKWTSDDSGFFGFWGRNSHVRKYKYSGRSMAIRERLTKRNLYYRLFDIPYREAFPLSSTALVWLTDGYHLMQFFYIKLFVASIVLYSPVFGWWKDGLIYLGVYYAVFNAFYKIFQK